MKIRESLDNNELEVLSIMLETAAAHLYSASLSKTSAVDKAKFISDAATIQQGVTAKLFNTERGKA